MGGLGGGIWLRHSGLVAILAHVANESASHSPFILSGASDLARSVLHDKVDVGHLRPADPKGWGALSSFRTFRN